MGEVLLTNCVQKDASEQSHPQLSIQTVQVRTNLGLKGPQRKFRERLSIN